MSDSPDDSDDLREDRPDAMPDERYREPSEEVRTARAREERSPEWPYAPPETRTERERPEPSEEQLSRWGLRARPDVDVAEFPEEVHVWCDLPGCAEDTIELTGDEWTLYVSAERADQHWEESGIKRRERSQHAERSISLPARSVIDDVEASFDDGVLFVRAPKHESERTQTIGFE